MSAKYFCDGCDREIKDFDRDRHRRNIVVDNAQISEVSLVVELCEPCLAHLKSKVTPKSWPRVARASAE